MYAPTNEVAKKSMGRNEKKVTIPASKAIPPKKQGLPIGYIKQKLVYKYIKRIQCIYFTCSISKSPRQLRTKIAKIKPPKANLRKKTLVHLYIYIDRDKRSIFTTNKIQCDIPKEVKSASTN